MAFTGDLEHLHIVDIIQLVHTTRKSGVFSVKGKKGESRVIFSNGHIVGASHLNKVRIGTVLVKMNAITIEDLKQALEVQKKAGKDRKPLITTLIASGKLGHDNAFKGLKKLIEITLVELIGWTTGTFTLDSEAIAVSPDCSYPISKMEQEINLDAQMILMDALRIFDERERDRQSGKSVPSDEEFFADMIPSPAENGEKSKVITADDLGLAELDRMERKIPQFTPVNELFDPAEIHRQKIKEILTAFSAEEQETFVSFLKKSTIKIDARAGAQRQDVRAKALILFGEDELIKHSVMTICKDEGVLVFAPDGEEELDRIIDQCFAIKALPILVFDAPGTPEGMLSEEKIIRLRQRVKEKYPQIATLQMVSPPDYALMLQSLRDGIMAVFPKPSTKVRKATFITDAILFLETFKSYIKRLFYEKDRAEANNQLSILKDRILALRELNEPSAVPFALLRYVSGICERSVTFIVRQTELIGERAIGVFAEKKEGPTSVTKLKIPLSKPSVFREVIERGHFFYGERNDEILKKHLFDAIGEPLSPTIILLPLKRHGKVVAVTYGDFGGKEASRVQSDMLEIMANEAGLVLENALLRKQIGKASRK